MYCPSCGEEVADDSAFCSNCGENLTPHSEPESVPADKATPSKSEPKAEPEEGGTDGSRKLGGGIVQTYREPKPDPEDGGTTTLKKWGYWGGRTVQVVLIGLAVIFILGGLDLNIIFFAAIGILALVLLAFAGAIELFIVRPSTR